jgi:hypothetical protein
MEQIYINEENSSSFQMQGIVKIRLGWIVNK